MYVLCKTNSIHNNANFKNKKCAVSEHRQDITGLCHSSPKPSGQNIINAITIHGRVSFSEFKINFCRFTIIVYNKLENDLRCASLQANERYIV